MNRRYAFITGNVLMVLGLLVMVLGIVCSVINQLPSLNMPEILTQGAILSIFLGAMLWLAGARLSGREKVADRYFWLRHYGDKRCRRHHPGH